MTISTATAALKLGITQVRVSQLCKSGRLPAVKGRHGAYEIKPEDLEAFKPKGAGRPKGELK